MKLTTLLQCLDLNYPQFADVVIQNIQADSRKIKPNDLFLAIPGLTTDGREHIAQAIAKGAVAVLAEAPYNVDKINKSKVPIVVISDLTKRLGIVASYFYGDPSHSMQVIGVTGTNGKSSTCHFIAELLRNLGCSAATIGTLGIGTSNGYRPTNFTTPDVITLQQNLAALRESGIQSVAMEVSSHALEQYRTVGVNFKMGIFTNLTQDHLDYHQTMSNYWQAKLKFFLDYAISKAVINLDDPYGRQLLVLLPANITVIGYTLETDRKVAIPCIIASDIQHSYNGIKTKLSFMGYEYTVDLPVLGNFNLSNMLAAIGAVSNLGYAMPDVLAQIAKVRNIPGRMQRIYCEHQPLVVVDYAHTPDALSRVLETLRYYCKGKLWCVFGCGGDRDRSKRPAMLSAALTFSDKVILTQDNPRTEDPQQIIADTLQNQSDLSKVQIELDRRFAIEMAIRKANEKDVILVAGKGHEDYQIIGTTKYPFSDIEVVENVMGMRVGF